MKVKLDMRYFNLTVHMKLNKLGNNLYLS